jgi:hypothetical protein
MSSTGARRLGVSAIAKKLAPYFIAAVALGWVLHHTDIHELGAALRHAPMAAFIGFSAFMLVLNCGADTFAMDMVFRRFGCRVPYKDLYLVRASTYLLAVLNYHVGQAAIVGYLYRVKRVPLLRASGWILFIIGINVGTLFLLASAGAARTSGQLAMLRLIPLVCGVGIVVYATLLTWKPRVLAERRILAPLLYLPAYFAVSSLPINVNGLGVAQLVAVFFFAPYAVVKTGTANPEAARKAAVMAYSLATSGISIVLQLVLGLLCLRWATARGLKPEPMEPIVEAAAG